MAEATTDLLGADRATIYLYSNRVHGYVATADCGTPPQVFERFAQKYFFGAQRAGGKRPETPFREVLAAGQVAYCTRDDAPTPAALALLEEAEEYALGIVPLRASVRGSIHVGLHQPPGFDDTALAILQGVARQASNLIEHSRLFKQMQLVARSRAGLAGLATAVNLETDPVRIALTENAALILTLRATPSDTPTPDHTATFQACVFDYSLVKQEPKDGSSIAVGANTSVTLEFENTGQCGWDNQTVFVFDSGDTLHAAAQATIHMAAVEPGQTVSVILEFKATKAQTYASTWSIRLNDGRDVGKPVVLTYKGTIAATFAPRATSTPTAAPTSAASPTSSGGGA